MRPQLRLKRRLPLPELAVEARQAIRRVPTSGVTGWVEGLGLPVQVCDLSQGGFAILAVQPFEPGAVHRFTFTVESGSSFQILARAAHCSEFVTGEEQFVSGWEFSQDGQDRVVREFLESAT